MIRVLTSVIAVIGFIAFVASFPEFIKKQQETASALKVSPAGLRCPREPKISDEDRKEYNLINESAYKVCLSQHTKQVFEFAIDNTTNRVIRLASTANDILSSESKQAMSCKEIYQRMNTLCPSSDALNAFYRYTKQQ